MAVTCQRRDELTGLTSVAELLNFVESTGRCEGREHTMPMYSRVANINTLYVSGML